MDDSRLTQVCTLIEPILADHQAELVELTCRPQGGQLSIRLIVDAVGGVTLKRCADINRVIGAALDASGLVEERHTIEVSSPGLDRPLKTRRDFERAVGEELKVHVRSDDGRSTEFGGMLLAVTPEAIVLKTEQGNVTVPQHQIVWALKAIRWSSQASD